MKLPALEVLVNYMAQGFAGADAQFALVGGLAIGARIGLQHLIAAATDADLAEVPPLLDSSPSATSTAAKTSPPCWKGFSASDRLN